MSRTYFSAEALLIQMFGEGNIAAAKIDNRFAGGDNVAFLEFLRVNTPNQYANAFAALNAALSAKVDSAREGVTKAESFAKFSEDDIIVGKNGQPDNPARPKASRDFVDSPKSVADACSLIDGKMDRLCGAMNSFVDALALLEAGIAGVVRPEVHTASVGDTSPVPPKPNQSRVAHSLDDLIGQMNRATDRVNSLSERIEF